jgi:putative exporter of polyketide antibiotics
VNLVLPAWGSFASEYLPAILVSVFFLLIIVAAIVIFVVSNRKDKRDEHEGRVADVVPVTMIQRLPADQYNMLVNSIGAMVAARGYSPLSHGYGMYVYQKRQQANWALAIVLMMLCFVPGLVYLVVGGSTKTVTMTVSDLGNAYLIIPRRRCSI